MECTRQSHGRALLAGIMPPVSITLVAVERTSETRTPGLSVLFVVAVVI